MAPPQISDPLINLIALGAEPSDPDSNPESMPKGRRFSRTARI